MSVKISDMDDLGTPIGTELLEVTSLAGETPQTFRVTARDLLRLPKIAAVLTVSSSGDLAASGAGALIVSTTETGITLTIPNDETLEPADWPIGAGCRVLQGAAGAVTIAAGSGVTLLSSGTAQTAGQHRSMVLVRTAANTWRAEALGGSGGGGMTNPMTTAGDLIVGGTGGEPTRLALGAEGQIPRSVGGAVVWTDETGGGGGDPAGADTELQYNDDGALAGAPGLRYDKASSVTTADKLDIGDGACTLRADIAVGRLDIERSHEGETAGLYLGAQSKRSSITVSDSGVTFAITVDAGAEKIFFEASSMGFVQYEIWHSGNFEPATVMSNPMTGVGDLITGGTAGVPTRLAPGSEGTILTMVSGAPAWVAPGFEKAAALNTVSTASSDLDAGWASDYTRFTHSAGAKTLNVRTNATHAIATMSKFPGRNAAANNLTIVPAGGVTINAPAGGTLVIPPQGTFTLVKVATDEWDLFGETVPA